MKTETREQKEEARLLELFKDADQDQLELLRPLIQNCAFMKIALEDLQTSIREKGAVDIYQNGENQKGLKTSAEMQAYNKLIVNYNSSIKLLSKILDKCKEDREARANQEPLNDLEKLRLGLPMGLFISKQEVELLGLSVDNDQHTNYAIWKDYRNSRGLPVKQPYWEEKEEELKES